MTDKITIERETLLPAKTIMRIKKECDALDLDIVAFAWRIQNAALAQKAEPPAPAAVPPFSNAQLDRLYANSPEHHKDATSAAAFKRIVKLAESAHGIAAAGDEP